MIIGIAGKSQSGKDTTASMINFMKYRPELSFHAYWNSDIPFEWDDNRIIHFADLLKDASEILLSLPKFTLQSQSGKRITLDWLDGMSTRTFLQLLGTAVRNEIHPDFWVRALMHQISKRKGVILIPDVRFPNEAQAIKDKGGFLIRIERLGAGAGEHISETALDDYEGWDLVIDNNGTLEDLYNKVKFLIENGNIPIE